MIGAARLPVLVLGALALAAPAAAEVAIRSGEHADYSRLVFYYEGPTDWTLGRSGEGYRLVTGALAPDYDTSQVFDFLPRTRLLAVTETAGGLDLKVGCACHADAFEHSPGIIVVDIKDGPAPEGSRFETRLPKADAGAVRIADGAGRGLLSLPITFDGPATAGGTGPTSGGAPALPAATGHTAAAQADGAAGHGTAPGTPADPAAPPDTAPAATLRAELGEGLGRAVAQGLATPAETAHLPGSEREDVLALPAGVDLRSGIDLATGAGPADPSALPCAEGALYDAAAWSGGATPADALETARMGFLDDLDAPGAEAVLTLARTYVSLGFGAEAIQVLETWPADPEAAAAVTEIAVQVDDPGRPGSARLQAQAGCDTPAALWALLAAAPGSPAVSGINLPAVQRALSALPIQLRRQIAPAVSERLRAAGHAVEAEAARATLTRATEAPGTAMEVEILRAEDHEAPRETVASVAETARGAGMPALVARAEMLARLARDRAPVDPALRRDVEAQVHQGKGSAESSALLDAYVAALAASASYDDALAILARLRQSDHADSYNLAGGTDRVMAAVAADPSDGSFLVETRSFAEGPLADLLSGEIVAGIAERMVGLGFLDEAGAYAATAPLRMAAADPLASDVYPDDRPDAAPVAAGAPVLLDATTEAVRQVALAGIAVGEGRPAEALARLSGVDTPEAAWLKAEALSALGAHAEAADAYLAMGETERAAAALWRAGHWEEASALMDDPLRQRIAGLMDDARDRTLTATTTIQDAGTSAGSGAEAAAGAPATAAGATPVRSVGPDGQPVLTLAEAEAWIEESAEVRAVAEALLTAPTARDSAGGQ